MRKFVSLGVGLALACASVALTAASVAPASGATVTVGARPANVPASYVTTPDGYFDPHCVYGVAANQVLVPDGTGEAMVTISAQEAAAAKANAAPGASAQSRAQPAYSVTAAQIAAAPHVPACPSPRYDLNGNLVPAGTDSAATAASQDPTINGWVENANSSALGPMSYIHAQWNVPPAPSTKSSQTVYFFPGLENTSGSVIIMQPVLAWNQGGSGISGWSGASWNCCSVGNVYHSNYIRVTGSTISGDVGGSGCNSSTGVCSSWSIVTYDWGSQASTTFNTNAGGRKMNWIFGGALEAYSVTSCSMFPGTSVTYSAFYFDKINGAHVATPSWAHGTAASGTSPSCSYGVSTSSNVTLKY